MKVAVQVTVDIDVDAYCTEYGLDRDEVRETVRLHVRNDVTEHLRGLGLLRETEA